MYTFKKADLEMIFLEISIVFVFVFLLKTSFLLEIVDVQESTRNQLMQTTENLHIFSMKEIWIESTC